MISPLVGIICFQERDLDLVGEMINLAKNIAPGSGRLYR